MRGGGGGGGILLNDLSSVSHTMCTLTHTLTTHPLVPPPVAPIAGWMLLEPRVLENLEKSAQLELALSALAEESAPVDTASGSLVQSDAPTMGTSPEMSWFDPFFQVMPTINRDQHCVHKLETIRACYQIWRAF